jgi:hypothetical protein
MFGFFNHLKIRVWALKMNFKLSFLGLHFKVRLWDLGFKIKIFHFKGCFLTSYFKGFLRVTFHLLFFGFGL